MSESKKQMNLQDAARAAYKQQQDKKQADEEAKRKRNFEACCNEFKSRFECTDYGFKASRNAPGMFDALIVADDLQFIAVMGAKHVSIHLLLTIEQIYNPDELSDELRETFDPVAHHSNDVSDLAALGYLIDHFEAHYI